MTAFIAALPLWLRHEPSLAWWALQRAVEKRLKAALAAVQFFVHWLFEVNTFNINKIFD